jgi:hypothetical protein
VSSVCALTPATTAWRARAAPGADPRGAGGLAAEPSIADEARPLQKKKEEKKKKAKETLHRID